MVQNRLWLAGDEREENAHEDLEKEFLQKGGKEKYIVFLTVRGYPCWQSQLSDSVSNTQETGEASCAHINHKDGVMPASFPAS